MPKKGVVKVHFSCTLDDGTLVESSEEEHPIEFTNGEWKYLPCLESAVEGMHPGESKTVTVPPEEGFGTRKEELMMEVDKKPFPENIDLEVGKTIEVPLKDGGAQTITVAGVSNSLITLDVNHPLAPYNLMRSFSPACSKIMQSWRVNF